ncbi:MAG: hypothetical protein AB7I01_18735 [Gammaproteobacteria bacterium]
MFKKVEVKPDFISAPHVREISSVSSCVSEDFCDYINFWKHNGYWFFNSPAVMTQLAEANHISLEGQTLFYYRIYPYQWRADAGGWMPFSPDEAFRTEVVEPADSYLCGFDVVTYRAQTSPECSPLSCNALASDFDVNEHCLFTTFDDAKAAIESGKMEKGEAGPYRIIEVHTL